MAGLVSPAATPRVIVHLVRGGSGRYGAENGVLTQLQGQRAVGIDARVVCLVERRLGAAAEDLPGALAARGVPLREIPIDGRFSVGMVRAVAEALTVWRASALHTHGLKADVVGLAAARLARVPLVVEVHGYTGANLLVRAYERLDTLVLRRADAVLVHSDGYAALLAARGVRRCVRFDKAVDLPALRASRGRADLRARLAIDPEAPVVGIVGRLSPEKGHLAFFAALERARERLPRLVGLVAGDGPLADRLRRAAPPRVRFAGYVEEVADLLDALDVVVSASSRESSPRALIEALALGRPVVATATAGARDLVEHDATGVLVDVGDARGLADGIVALLEDPERARRLGSAAAGAMRARFDPLAAALACGRVYDGLSGRDPARGRRPLGRR